MSTAKSYIQTIVGVVETLGYTFTDEFFDFDNFPTSGNDNVYRLEATSEEVVGISGNRVEKKKTFKIWIAYKISTTGDRQQETYDVLDAKEALEDEIFKALSGVQVKIVKNIMSGIQNDYILVKLTGNFVYWRDLTA